MHLSSDATSELQIATFGHLQSVSVVHTPLEESERFTVLRHVYIFSHLPVVSSHLLVFPLVLLLGLHYPRLTSDLPDYI